MNDVKKIMEKYSAFREGQDWPNGIEEVGTLIAHIEKLDGENAALKAKLAGEIEYANNKDAMLDSVRKSSALKIDALRAIVDKLRTALNEVVMCFPDDLGPDDERAFVIPAYIVDNAREAAEAAQEGV